MGFDFLVPDVPYRYIEEVMGDDFLESTRKSDVCTNNLY
jgi:hypothetical protein